MNDKSRNRRTKPRKISVVRIIAALALTGIVLAAFPVLKHYISADMTWLGGVPRLVRYMAAGVYFGVFPAVAAVIAVVWRYGAGKTTLLPAVIAASATWAVQYAIVLVSIHVAPDARDALYGAVSVFCAAALAVLVGSPQRTGKAS